MSASEGDADAGQRLAGAPAPFGRIDGLSLGSGLAPEYSAKEQHGDGIQRGERLETDHGAASR